MRDTTLAEAVTSLAAPLAASLDLEIWGLELSFGGRSLVRLYVEGGDGVDIDRCAELSRLLSLSLDVEDVIPGAYVLEVSSPGLERVFFKPEQLQGYTGRVLEVTLHGPADARPGKKKLLGTLASVADGKITLVPLDGGEDAPKAVFAWDDAKKIKLVHFLPEPGGVRGKTVGRTKTQKSAVKKPKAPGKGETAAGPQTAAKNRGEEGETRD